MASNSCPRWFDRWSAKQTVLTTMLAALAAIAIFAGFSITLAPAHIFFSITNATTTAADLIGGYYNFSLVAHNPSRRMSVKYTSLSAQIWYSYTGYIPADDVNIAAALPGWQPPRNTTAIAVSVENGQYDVDEPTKGSAVGNATTTTTREKQLVEKECRVVVEAKVRFKFGMQTRPYTVRVTCFHVNFTADGANHGTVPCS